MNILSLVEHLYMIKIDGEIPPLFGGTIKQNLPLLKPI